MTLPLAILLILLGALFRRAVWSIVRLVLMALAVLFAGRVALTIDVRIADPGPFIAGAAGAALALFVCYRLIYNALVRANLRDVIRLEKDKARAREI